MSISCTTTTSVHYYPFYNKTVSYLPSIVTMAILTLTLTLAISEIFSIKEWPDLEIWV